MKNNTILILGSKRFVDEMVELSSVYKKKGYKTMVADHTFNYNLNYLPIHTVYIYNKFSFIPFEVYNVIKQAKELGIDIEYYNNEV